MADAERVRIEILICVAVSSMKAPSGSVFVKKGRRKRAVPESTAEKR
jgi:hypothetical protein